MTPGQLVKAVAIALDVPEETVVQHDRNLVVAGLRTKGGRGRSAPAVTPLDAARLLTATLASFRTKDSVSTVREFEGAIFYPGPEHAAEVRAARRHHLFYEVAFLSLPEQHNFIEGLAALIKDASGPLPTDQVEQFLKRFADLMIHCDMPGAYGTFSFERGVYSYKGARPAPTADEEEAYWERMKRREAGFHWREVGIRQRRSLNGNAIMLMGLAFRENGLAYPTTAKAIDALVGPLPNAEKAKARAGKKTRKAA